MQFCTEVLDLGVFRVTRTALGSVVSDVLALEDEELLHKSVWTYSITRLYGETWVRGVAGKGAQGRIAISRSFGHVFSKGFLASSRSEAVNGQIRTPSRSYPSITTGKKPLVPALHLELFRQLGTTKEAPAMGHRLRPKRREHTH